jgi:cellobiose phosphorylase
MSLARLTDPAPHARLLSNGRYTALITGAGTGYSSWNGYALTAWSADRTEDGDGYFVYLRDLDRGVSWSAGHQPIPVAAESYDVGDALGRVTIERVTADIETRLEICVAPDRDVELRRLHVRNRTRQARRIEVTSYAEVVLNSAAAHAAHPAFSKLFVQTEFVQQAGILLAHRRARSNAEQHPWMMHALLGGNGHVEYETDRARFIGRGRTAARPCALDAALSATAGNVLDPVFSLRRTLCLDAGADAQLTFLLGVAPTRDAALQLAALENDVAAFERADEHERDLLHRLGISDQRAAYWQDLASAMLYSDPTLRADAAVIRRAHGQLSDLTQYGVGHTGLLAAVQLERTDQLQLARDLVQAKAYWQNKGLQVQLVLLCGEATPLTDNLRRALAHDSAVILRRAEVPPAALDTLLAAAHLVVSGTLPALEPSTESNAPPTFRAQAFQARPSHLPRGANEAAQDGAESLLFNNGYGGFSSDGSEYIIQLQPGVRQPPMPWVNVVANETFGFLVSERGAGYTWSRNSRENRLTPWSNDPISDPHGEAVYIRDEDARVFWSPLPGPAPDRSAYAVRHGFGSTRWRHASQELEQETVQFVPRHDPVKITRLRLTNTSAHMRHLSLFSYTRLVMGVLPAESGRFVVTEVDSETGALIARNRLNNEFSDAVVFAAAVTPDGATPLRVTGDRTTFIGRNGSAVAPAALCDGSPLDGRTGAGLDPCAALQFRVDIASGATIECAFLLGETTDDASARALVERYRRAGAIDAALEAVRAFWRETLRAVQVRTPSPAIDLMINGWLLYQDLSCRLWGRSAFYQSGGAFGFRDQLQDSAALIYTRPDLTRAQIVLHAAHQFVEGDVLHWWHPPTSRGIRTRFSDDLVWLPYIVAFYVHTTGDWSVLDESVGFMTARALAAGEDEAYLLPTPSGEAADVYAHCCRALDRSLTRGVHGLPLMGTGDWNDGMNRVGREGRGESVWMGFFLYHILEEFIPLCARRGDDVRIAQYRTYQEQLTAALNDAGWDGAWYRRAYYDDGTPLGSALNDECRIDALVQAWSVLSNAVPRPYAVRAMDAVEQQLVSMDAGIIRLLAPPFDRSPHDPGYIKGYVPGIRENGGQYTHAAVWVVRALAELGRGEHAAAFLEMLMPIHHARTAAQVATYQVEPYVVAADIYGVSPHLGRGGWTWYTGSAGWMYRVALESVLGVRVVAGKSLRLKPCVPDHWTQFSVELRLPDGQTRYAITVRNPTGKAAAVRALTIDGHSGIVEEGTAQIGLLRDGGTHRVEVMLGET